MRGSLKRISSPEPQPRRKFIVSAAASAAVMVVKKQGSYLVVAVTYTKLNEARAAAVCQPRGLIIPAVLGRRIRWKKSVRLPLLRVFILRCVRLILGAQRDLGMTQKIIT